MENDKNNTISRLLMGLFYFFFRYCGNIKADFLLVEKKINCDLASALSMIDGDFFLQPPSLREVDRRRFCGETEGVLLCLARFPRHTEPAAKAAEEPKVNSPSVSAKKHRRASSLTEGAFKSNVKS